MSDGKNQNESDANVSSAEPYRTPAEVEDKPLEVGLMRSKKAWFLLLGLLVLGGAAAFALVAPTTSHIQNFGGSRRSGPPQEVLIEDYEVQMFAEEALPSAP